ncbi:hypothetical protein PN36_23135 [Candidatus Thiomargarita nelsonii]|uniref:Uncharacterized protein n=1 Tax=Candidatus Thiomargarita nelsonii TaxID=1003181 RepID=A0A0A6P4H4_9GAMM|nr:hypothetical protein PN36_23135 [Candidatus Thiomargarita nelsonii]
MRGTQGQSQTQLDITGTFLVQDAKNDRDDQNRRIIPMQDFVADYKVKTVFGLGGRYLVGKKKPFKVSTMQLFKKDKVFSC